MKTKAFTLVELLGIIVLLALVSMIGYTSVSKMLRNSERKDYDYFLNNLYVASETYVEINKNKLVSLKQNNGYILIDIDVLYHEHYIANEPINPKTKQSALDDKIKVVNNNGVLKYEYVEVQ